MYEMVEKAECSVRMIFMYLKMHLMLPLLVVLLGERYRCVVYIYDLCVTKSSVSHQGANEERRGATGEKTEEARGTGATV